MARDTKKKKADKSYSWSLYYQDLQDDETGASKATVAAAMALAQTSAEISGDPTQADTILFNSLGSFTQSLALTKDPYSAAGLAALTTFSDILGGRRKKKEQRRREKEARRAQVRQVSQFLQQEALSTKQSKLQQESRYKGDFLRLQDQIVAGAQEYNAFVGDGLSESVTAQRKKIGYRRSAEAAISETYSDISTAVHQLSKRSDYLASTREGLEGSDDLRKAKTALDDYNKLLEEQYG